MKSALGTLRRHTDLNKSRVRSLRRILGIARDAALRSDGGAGHLFGLDVIIEAPDGPSAPRARCWLLELQQSVGAAPTSPFEAAQLEALRRDRAAVLELERERAARTRPHGTTRRIGEFELLDPWEYAPGGADVP